MASNCHSANEEVNFEQIDEGMRYAMNSHIDLLKVAIFYCSSGVRIMLLLSLWI